MAKIYPIQNAFSAGELSPRMFTRSDVKGYQQGTAILENMITYSQGPAATRNGDATLIEFDNVENMRVFNFFMPNGESFIVAVYEDTMTVLDPDGFFIDNQLVTNFDFEDGNNGWTPIIAGSATVTVVDGICFLQLGNNTFCRNRQEGIVIPTPGIEHNLNVKLITNSTSPFFRIEVGEGASQNNLINYVDIAYDNISLQFTPTISPINITISCEEDPANDRFLQVDHFAIFTTEPNPTFAAPWKTDDLRQLQFAMPPGEDVMYFVHPFNPPYKLAYDKLLFSWTLVLVTFVGVPSEWVAGNYPSSVTFYQGRSWWGGTPDQPEMFWGSQSGLFEDLTPGIESDDGIVFTLSNRGAIRWMLGVKTLLIGTDVGEFIATGSNDPSNTTSGIIEPGNIHVIQQSAYGSALVQPVKIGNSAFFITPDGRKLRSTEYSWQADAWISSDITFASEHITEDRVIHIVHSQHPDNLIWMVTSTAGLLACTYDPGNNIIGWHRHPTFGLIADVTAIRVRGRTLRATARIFTDGNNLKKAIVCIEAEDLYMDAVLRREYDEPTNVVLELEIYEGLEVDVLVDGATHPPVTVVGGQITTQYFGNVFQVGSAYTARLKTLPFDVQDPNNSGQALMKRFNMIYARVMDSAMPKVNGRRPPEREPSTPMNEPQPAVIFDDVRVANLGWDRFAQITIEQDLPLPLTIVGIFGEIAGEKT